MSQLFLTSEANRVLGDLPQHFEKPIKGQTLAFIDTAAEVESGDKQWLKNDRNALVKLGFNVFDYTLTDKNATQLQNDLSSAEVFFLSGGNTFYLLQQAQQSGFIDFIREAVLHQGKPYIGSSAGSVIAGADILPVKNLDSMEKAAGLKGTSGFNLINFVVMPHWGSDSFKKHYLNQRLNFAYHKDQHPLVVLTDYQYVYVKDGMSQIIDVRK